MSEVELFTGLVPDLSDSVKSLVAESVASLVRRERGRPRFVRIKCTVHERAALETAGFQTPNGLAVRELAGAQGERGFLRAVFVVVGEEMAAAEIMIQPVTMRERGQA